MVEQTSIKAADSYPVRVSLICRKCGSDMKFTGEEITIPGGRYVHACVGDGCGHLERPRLIYPVERLVSCDIGRTISLDYREDTDV